MTRPHLAERQVGERPKDAKGRPWDARAVTQVPSQAGWHLAGDEGLDEGREEGLEAARDDGLEEGLEEGRDEVGEAG